MGVGFGGEQFYFIITVICDYYEYVDIHCVVVDVFQVLDYSSMLSFIHEMEKFVSNSFVLTTCIFFSRDALNVSMSLD